MPNYKTTINPFETNDKTRGNKQNGNTATMVNHSGSPSTIVNQGRGASTIVNQRDEYGTIVNTTGAATVNHDLRKSEWRGLRPIFQVGENCEVVGELTTAVEGAQATLYACLWKGEQAVLKLFHRMRGMDQHHEQKFREMYQKLSQCTHAAPIWEYGVHEEHWYEIIPYYAKGSLADRRNERLFTEKEIEQNVLPQMNDALDEIHRQGIWHNDIKPENVMVSDSDQLILIDFGVASISQFNMTVATGLHGTQPYMNRQALSREYNASTDYYALGVTLYNLLYGEFPKVKNWGTRMDRPRKKCSDRIYDLLCALTFESVLGNPAKPWGHDEVVRWLNMDKTLTVPEPISTPDPQGVHAKIRMGTKQYSLEELVIVLGHEWEKGKSELIRGYLSNSLKIASENRNFNGDQRAMCVELWKLADLTSKSKDQDAALCQFLYGAEVLLREADLLENSELHIYWRGTAYSDRKSLKVLGSMMCSSVINDDKSFLWMATGSFFTDYLEARSPREELAEILKCMRALTVSDEKNKTYIQGLLLQGLIDDKEFQNKYYQSVLKTLQGQNSSGSSAEANRYCESSFQVLLDLGIIKPTGFARYQKLPNRVKAFLAAFLLTGEKSFVADGFKFNSPAELKEAIIRADSNTTEQQRLITAIASASTENSPDKIFTPQMQAWLKLFDS